MTGSLPRRLAASRDCPASPMAALHPDILSAIDDMSDTAPMHTAILTFDAFNELDSLIALGILNRVKRPGWRVTLSSPAHTVTSMIDVVVHAQSTLAEASEADVVFVDGGTKTREIAADETLLSQLRLDPARQLIGAQCPGTLLLAKLGLLAQTPACTDLVTKPWVI